MKDISTHILDIVQNSVSAGASIIDIQVVLNPKEDILTVTIEDNGCGMDKEKALSATDPFMTGRKTRKVGLGIPFFQASALQCGGSFDLESTPQIGTAIRAVFRLSHIDTPPLGDIAATVFALVIPNTSIEFRFVYTNCDKSYRFDTREIKTVLGEEIPLSLHEVMQWIHDDLYRGIEEISGGVQQS